ncbi:hypothetical protein [Streptomyces sp. NBC_00370]|uniref:hypothetical protein n=1 Tax=Streptomyces sp. NBC_00370 TaxID=2975728 RepID=UPI002E26A74F
MTSLIGRRDRTRTYRVATSALTVLLVTAWWPAVPALAAATPAPDGGGSPGASANLVLPIAVLLAVVVGAAYTYRRRRRRARARTVRVASHEGRPHEGHRG